MKAPYQLLLMFSVTHTFPETGRILSVWMTLPHVTKTNGQKQLDFE